MKPKRLLHGLFLMPILFLGYSAYVLNAHAVSLSHLNRLAIGMSPKQVEAVLGKPDSTEKAPQGSERWRYHGATWCMVDIEFNTNGRLATITHDH